MNLLPLAQLGAIEQPAGSGNIFFGVLLPGITPADGTIVVRLISVQDQFIQAIQPYEQDLVHGVLAPYGDYWSGVVNTAPIATPGSTEFVYRYALKKPDTTCIDNIIDPFATEYGYGDIPAITLGTQEFVFDAAVESNFKVPNIRDSVVYELSIAEFGGDIDGTIGLLPYLADLGINVIEVMPVCNTAPRIDWGYDPISYFGVASRLGKSTDFQRLVQEAHRNQIAVVLDAVYAHVVDQCAYFWLYSQLEKASPFVGPFAEDQYFNSTDFSKQLTQDYYFTVNVFWMQKFHVDGFRYDDVPEYWDQTRTVGNRGYSDLVLATLNYVQTQGAANADFARFFPVAGGEITLLQIAEFLGASNKFLTMAPDTSSHVLYDTVSNSTWQNDTMQAAKACAVGSAGAIVNLGNCFGLAGYPASLMQNGNTITKSAMQYVETHDHERFICTFGTHYPDQYSQDELLLVGNRSTQWFKVQPYLIGLFAAKGTPLLWQGQEICQDYFVPDSNNISGARTVIYRPVNFNYFYDDIGKAMIKLVRKLADIRHSREELRGGDHFFYQDQGAIDAYISKGIMLFSRTLGNQVSMIALNFTDQAVNTSITVPLAGLYMDQLGSTPIFTALSDNSSHEITVPSNYGCILTVN